jgi:S-adenosylmethionine:diacylglycerol 3-amino-3-carboxypropyl transferase
VFDYLVEGARVTAVDLNAAQIALTELKAIACQKLTYEHFFEIFAKNKINLLKAKYESDIRPLLTERSRQFWDSHIKTCVIPVPCGLCVVIRTHQFKCRADEDLCQNLAQCIQAQLFFQRRLDF